MPSVFNFTLLLLLLLIAAAVIADDDASTTTTSTTTTTTITSVSSSTDYPETVVSSTRSEKIARRIIDDRLSPPKATEFSLWNKRLPALGEIHHRLNSAAAPKVTEDVDDNVNETALPKKTRTVGPVAGSQDPACCGGEAEKSSSSNGKEKSSQEPDEPDVERGAADGPAARFHGNRPYDDRYGSAGWKSSSYLGYGKDKGYYDTRSQAYDRYGTTQRPSSNYAVDGDRYGTAQRPATSGDRFGLSSSGNSGYNNRPNGGYQSGGGGGGGNGGGYGAYAGGPYNRPRPGNGYGVSGNLDESEGEYPFEGDQPGQPNPNIANLQTQKAVALKALAGVALIGAAAALASNPVLLPISVISGRRRKRAVEVESDNYALTALLQGYIQPKPNEVASSSSIEDSKPNTTTTTSSSSSTSSIASQELVISPECVARLACHVHRDYLDELDKSRAELEQANATQDAATALTGLEHWFDSLIHSNILVADYLSKELKTLIKSAVIVGSNRNETCDQFSCLNVQDSKYTKEPSKTK